MKRKFVQAYFAQVSLSFVVYLMTELYGRLNRLSVRFYFSAITKKDHDFCISFTWKLYWSTDRIDRSLSFSFWELLLRYHFELLGTFKRISMSDAVIQGLHQNICCQAKRFRRLEDSDEIQGTFDSSVIFKVFQ